MIEKTWHAKDESGAETVQLAMAIPMVFIAAMATVQLGIMAFCVLTLDGSAQQAAWAVDLDELIYAGSPQSANELLSNEINRQSVCLDLEKLRISNAAFTSTDTYSKPPVSKPIANRNVICDEDNRYQLAQMTRETYAGLVEFDISYELPTLIELPGLSHMTVSRHIARERVLTTRTEIS